MRPLFSKKILLFVLLAGTFVFLATKNFFVKDARRLAAGIFFVDSTTTEQLKRDYGNAQNGGKKIKILVVPGHDRESSGAQFRGLSEFDFNLELGLSLVDFLKQNPAFEVVAAQGWNGYNPALASYFSNNRAAIEMFRQSQQGITNGAFDAGIVERQQGVFHNFAPNETALKLYGINKWANENGVNLVLHIHFNDDPEKRGQRIGRYGGFAIYVPERQFSNAKGSSAIAHAIFERLARRIAPSNLPLESAGIVEDQELIGIGSNNSLDSAAMLIEYSYIYEPQIRESATRSLALKEAAWHTYLGIESFFEGSARADALPQTVLLPHYFSEHLSVGMRGSAEAYLLQIALAREGFYPPEGSTLEDCPMNGNFLDCTVRAVKAFQRGKGIEPAMGEVGGMTRAELNRIYGE